MLLDSFFMNALSYSIADYSFLIVSFILVRLLESVSGLAAGSFLYVSVNESSYFFFFYAF